MLPCSGLVKISALVTLPFVLSGCAALELAQRAEDIEKAVDLGTDFQDAIGASEGGTGVPAGVSLITEEEFAERAALGSASYVGYAGLFVPTGDNENAILTAEADISVDFASNSVEAEFNDWLGGRVTDNYDPIGTTGSAASASGDIAFSNGTFNLDGGDASFTGDVSGEVTYRGDDYGIDGSVEGAIGTQNDGPESIAAVADADAVITLNGEVVDDPDAEFGFYGEITE